MPIEYTVVCLGSGRKFKTLRAGEAFGALHDELQGLVGEDVDPDDLEDIDLGDPEAIEATLQDLESQDKPSHCIVVQVMARRVA